MFDGSISTITADRKSRGFSLAAGLLIAGSCFALLFAAIAHLIPSFLRFTESPYARLLAAVNAVFIVVVGLIVCLKRRAKRLQVRPHHLRDRS
jgi:hypothetical protein